MQKDGGVAKTKSDYETRKGVTSKPVPKNNVKSVLLRCFDHFMKTMVYVKAGVC